jgi:hypothetical protein
MANAALYTHFPLATHYPQNPGPTDESLTAAGHLERGSAAVVPKHYYMLYVALRLLSIHLCVCVCVCVRACVPAYSFGCLCLSGCPCLCVSASESPMRIEVGRRR